MHMMAFLESQEQHSLKLVQWILFCQSLFNLESHSTSLSYTFC